MANSIVNVPTSGADRKFVGVSMFFSSNNKSLSKTYAFFKKEIIVKALHDRYDKVEYLGDKTFADNVIQSDYIIEHNDSVFLTSLLDSKTTGTTNVVDFYTNFNGFNVSTKDIDELNSKLEISKTRINPDNAQKVEAQARQWLTEGFPATKPEHYYGHLQVWETDFLTILRMLKKRSDLPSPFPSLSHASLLKISNSKSETGFGTIPTLDVYDRKGALAEVSLCGRCNGTGSSSFFFKTM